MHFTCVCGQVISDTTDRLRNKAYLLPDQDWFLIAANARIADALDIYGLLRNMRRIYSCYACGRLAIPDPVTDSFLWYLPELDDRRPALGSTYGDSYKVRLIGTWRSDLMVGSLRWDKLGGGNDRSVERFSEKAAFMQRYFDSFQRLTSENNLSSACLRDDSAVVHLWEEREVRT